MSTVFRWTLEEYEALAEVSQQVFDWRHPRHIELIRGYLEERGEPAKLSLEEYERMIEAGLFAGPNRRRLELIEGEILKMSPINPPHAYAMQQIVDWSYEKTPRRTVEVRVQSPLRLAKIGSEPEPDVAWVAPGGYSRRHPEEKDVLLLVEVAATSLPNDTIGKAALYAKAGIRDYWVVNLRDQTIEVRRDPGPDGYRSWTRYSGNDELRPLACPDAVLVPATLWAPIPEAEED